MRKLFISFEELAALCKDISAQVKKSKFKPDIIIGVARGGWIPARLISDYLEVKGIASIGVYSYDKAEKKCKPYLTEELGVDIKDKSVLVVDEIVDTGESLEVAKEYLESFKPKQVKFAALHCKPWSKFKPDYFANETREWVVYPWEEKESES